MSYVINTVELGVQMFEIEKKVVAQNITEQNINSQKIRWKLR